MIRAAALAALLAGAAPFAAPGTEAAPQPEHPSLLADLSAEAYATLAEIDPPAADDTGGWLDAVVGATGLRELDLGELVVRTDPRWFATMPDPDARAPIVELRRWPGDTVLALYAIGAAHDSVADGPPLADAEFELQSADDPSRRLWSGRVTTPAGSRPALWVERELGQAAARLGTLVLPGDAGFGAAGIDGLTQEALAVFLRIEVRERAWALREGLASGQTVRLPVAADVPGDGDEEQQPWQVALAQGFSVGLPPGIRAGRLDYDVPLARAVPGGRLWLRGRYRDMEGQRVVLGDRERFGYIARVDTPDKAWKTGKRPPLAAPNAEPLVSRPFSLAKERCEAKAATVERWQEPGFDGDWLVMRLHFDDHGYEFGLPLLAGRRSASLLWIPVTWRDEGRPPAPPPVDPADRFGIRFERLTPVQRKDRPWVEGFLSVPGLRAEVARGWFPAASLRSDDGYPVRLLDAEGQTRGRLERVEADELSELTGRLPGLEEIAKPGRHRAARVLRDPNGRHLFVAEEGHAFRFEPDFGGEGSDEERLGEWRELWQLMMSSVRLQHGQP